jgi:oligoendopeptidase F
MQNPHKKSFIPANFTLDNWESLKPYVEELKNRNFFSVQELHTWFIDRSNLEAWLSENFAWRYIRMTCDTTNEKLIQDFNFFVTEIQPHVAPEINFLNKKAIECIYLNEIKSEGYEVMIRSMKKDLEIFREDNILLQTQLQTEEQKFGMISGAMMVEIDGKEVTLPQANDLLLDTDRKKREDAYYKIQERRLKDADNLHNLFTRLIHLRHQIAQNAGFDNYRDYMFVALGRFDYTPTDCFNFHKAIEKTVVPLLNELALERKQALQLDKLRPWDAKVDVSGKLPLKPFKNGEELISKTTACFHKLHPYLGECLETLQRMNHLDLESRKGKAPGGYNYPLDKTGVPFIFMNATSSVRDMVTLLHEGGHAVHSVLVHSLELNAFKHPPSEVAELASMSMELIAMDCWDLFFENEEDLKHAKKQHLQQIIETLPWIATIDKFQHWIYENPTHPYEERTNAWNKIYKDFSDAITDWEGLKHYKDIIWQKQLHLFEVPFYYIEYGIAQLGAIAIWKNYCENPEKTLNQYLAALKLGYTKPIREIYTTAGISFDFSETYIAGLMQFVKEEIKKLG